MGRKNQVPWLALAIPVLILGMSADVSAPPDSAAEWAGVYTYSPQSSTMVYRLVITRDGQFRLVLGGCFGSSEINRGSVAWRDGALILRPQLRGHGVLSQVSSMLPVRSGTRLYLITDDPLMQFESDDA